MGTQGKYNLLFIHDDGATRSFRIGRGVLRGILCTLVLLPLLSAAGLWSGWMAWERGQAWTDEQQTLQRELAALKVQLARLSNVEALMRISETGPLPGEPGALPMAVAGSSAAASAPSTTNQAVPGGAGVGSVATPAQAGTQGGSGTAASSSSAAAAGAGANAVNGTAGANGPGATSVDAASKAQGQATAAQSSAEAAPEASNPDLAVIDKDVVSLNNVSARLGQDRRLRVRLDLHNDSGQQVSGKIEYFIVTTEGQRTPLPASDASFRISRLKKFVTSSLVPDNLSNLTNASLLVEVINADGVRLFRQLYPISD